MTTISFGCSDCSDKDREIERLRQALCGAAHAMTMAAAGLKNGGGTGHEVARLEAAAQRAEVEAAR